MTKNASVLEKRKAMGKLYSTEFELQGVCKEIAVYCDDATAFELNVDVLTTSAYVGSYEPMPGTMFRALSACGVHVSELAANAEFDLRTPCNVWLSKEIGQNNARIGRIGCIELLDGRAFRGDRFLVEQTVLRSVKSYFLLLDMAANYEVRMETVAMPLLGGGSQRLSPGLVLTPLINECMAFLKRNSEAKRILFIEKDPEKAEMIANCLKNSLRFAIKEEKRDALIPKTEGKKAFISYSSGDKNIADNLCAKLEQRGVKVWYAPRDVSGAYAEAIARAIDSCTHFIVILSQNSIASEHVLNEIDLAFQKLPEGIFFKPLRIDEALLTPSFKYYLSRQHWMDATHPPLEARLNEFVESVLGDE